MAVILRHGEVPTFNQPANSSWGGVVHGVTHARGTWPKAQKRIYWIGIAGLPLQRTKPT